MNTTPSVLLSVNSHAGYSPEQITDTLTLGELLEAVEQAIEDFGAEARIVVANGQRYGAGFGGIPRREDLFERVEEEFGYACTNCDAEGLDDEEAFAHSRENRHCLVDVEGREAYCYRADH
ncbi:hypothetical protein [Microbacterium caowuchunii]|uniref:Uncharacterized protein n=1 Tax=Microbacterium caowuchunii TaxID=2614638 RepID=A0A5N0TIR9_9MICO|nr:hypothetical protein [Microbacterium caowuchunii]KAA9133776.1 hypothetical protein F6B40_08480 [Microbacterium caowuchunii]